MYRSGVITLGVVTVLCLVAIVAAATLYPGTGIRNPLLPVIVVLGVATVGLRLASQNRQR